MNRIIERIHGEAAYRQGLTGAGIAIAVLDTGVFPHLAIKDRVQEFHDYVNHRRIPYDDNGHGTHILGIIGGNLARYQFHGVAPNCMFHVYKILNERGNGKIHNLTRALWDLINHVSETGIRIVNISVGVAENLAAKEQMELDQAINAAWEKGIVIVAAAGNNGPGENTVTLPGINKRVITVGCSDDGQSAGRSGLKRGYSGVGPTSECIVKPEILVPGTNVKSCGIQSEVSFSVKSGTSMAAPVVTGMIALLLEKYPDLTPDQVKIKMYQSVRKAKESRQCWGYLLVDDFLR